MARSAKNASKDEDKKENKKEEKKEDKKENKKEGRRWFRRFGLRNADKKQAKRADKTAKSATKTSPEDSKPVRKKRSSSTGDTRSTAEASDDDGTVSPTIPDNVSVAPKDTFDAIKSEVLEAEKMLRLPEENVFLNLQERMERVSNEMKKRKLEESWDAIKIDLDNYKLGLRLKLI